MPSTAIDISFRSASLLFIITLFLLSPSFAEAATINVNTTADEWNETGSGSGCSLREAIESANKDVAWGGCTAGSGFDTIQIPAGTYQLTRDGRDEDSNVTGDLDITSNMKLQGATSGQTKIQGLWNHPYYCGDRLLDIRSGSTFDMDRVILTRGCINALQRGGAMLISSCGTTTINNSVVTENWADYGGGLYVHCAYEVIINNTTISKNYAGTFVLGGIGYGGAVYSRDEWVTLRNATVTGNDALTDGGGLYGTEAAYFTFINSIVAGNTSVGDSDISGIVTNPSHHSIIGDKSGVKPYVTGTCSQTGMQCDLQAGLLALGDNGGNTLTHALDVAGSSPALDAADCGTALTTDQRGFNRGSPCDIGAYEHSLAAGEFCDGEDNECDSNNCNNYNACCAACVHGSCNVNGSCSCESNWDGDLCTLCREGYFGASCQACPACVNGACDDGTDGSGICECNEGWDGELCNIPLGEDGDLDDEYELEVEAEDEPDGDVTDGDVVDDDILDGDIADGDLVDGDMVDGDVVDGDILDGDVADGDAADGDVVDGDVVDGDIVDGDIVDGDATDIDIIDGDIVDGDSVDDDVADGDVVDGTNDVGGSGGGGCRSTAAPGIEFALFGLFIFGFAIRKRQKKWHLR